MSERIEPEGWAMMTPSARVDWVMRYQFPCAPKPVEDRDRMRRAHEGLAELLGADAALDEFRALGRSEPMPDVTRALWEALRWLRTAGYETRRVPTALTLVISGVLEYHRILGDYVDPDEL